LSDVEREDGRAEARGESSRRGDRPAIAGAA
jgi:hypothetical protein